MQERASALGPKGREDTALTVLSLTEIQIHSVPGKGGTTHCKKESSASGPKNKENMVDQVDTERPAAFDFRPGLEASAKGHWAFLYYQHRLSPAVIYVYILNSPELHA